MTDTNKLKELAERALDCTFDSYVALLASAKPQEILGLIDEVEQLRSRLEIDERIPHDGISCRDETIKALDEKCDKLKAENDALRGAVEQLAEMLNSIHVPIDLNEILKGAKQ
ncbi:TPA: hypothetical protein ACQGQ1_000973 [Pseudomonas aeruginosa]|uniref:hypothetical protein n=1 Tax=Pseudomonas aeruginosa TaxID=287 RepID=UPI002A6AC06F|nr:hypothetical protein [Pseudomonas aeruginosa]MDY1510708.1 hypothetical protein [Pseudomonas aeruginosa]